MWEGQATSRRSQQAAGIALAALSLPFTGFGAFAVWLGITKGGMPLGIAVTAAAALLTGLVCLSISYRLFFGRGVRQGGGVMSPTAYRIGGLLFVVLAAFLSYQAVTKRDPGGAIAAGGCLLLALFFFAAARHRSAMRRTG